MIPKNPGVAKKIIPKNPRIAQKGTQKSGSNPQKSTQNNGTSPYSDICKLPPRGTGGKFGLKGQISHFSRAFEGNMSKWSLNGWETLNYIFFDQTVPSVIRFCVENWQIMHFETIFRPIPQLSASPSPTF